MAPPTASVDRWDLAVLAAVPFLAAMISCAAAALDVLPGSIPDVSYYARIGWQMAQGLVPYRDFPFEYPPLALVPMAIPELLWRGGPGLLEYQWSWAVMTGLAATAVALLVAWIAGRPGSIVTPWRALLVWALIALVETPLIAWRYDILAVLLAVLGVALVLAGRPAWSGVALAAGALLKLFPFVLVPLLAVWLLARGDRSGATRLVGASIAGAVVGIAGATAVVGPDNAFQFLGYQQARSVQIESLAATVALLGHLAGLIPVFLGYGFQSLQVHAPGLAAAAAASTPLLLMAVIAVIALVGLRLWSERATEQGPQLSTLVRGIVATIIVLLLANKVFSAQYMLWFLPFACLLPRRQAALVVATSVLSVLVFPLGYRELAALEVQAVLTLAARNLLLVALLVWLVVDLRPLPGREGYGAWLPPWSRSERTSYTR